MQLFPSGRNSGADQSGAESFPGTGLPHGVRMTVEQIDRSVKPGWFNRNLPDVYKAHIRGILPIQEDFPVRADPALYTSPSPYYHIVLLSFKDALEQATHAEADFSAKFRKAFGWHEGSHHLAELASAGLDFAHRLRRHGKISEASEIVTDALFVAQSHRDPFLQARANYEAASVLSTTGGYTAASGLFSAMLKCAGPLLGNHPDCMHWALPRIPRVIDHVFLHSFPAHDNDAKALLSHSYLLLKVLLENRSFITSCCDSAVVAPAMAAAARVTAFMGDSQECQKYTKLACSSAASNPDPMIACQTAIGLGKMFMENRDSKSGLRVVLESINAIEPRLVPKSGRPNLDLIRRFGDVLEVAADLHLDLGAPGPAVQMMAKRDDIFKKFKLGLPDDGNSPELELV